MTHRQGQEMKRKMREAGFHADAFMAKKDGTFEVRAGYFYTHGRTAEKFAAQVMAAAEKAGLGCVILDAENRWRSWPKTSFFWVRFRISEPEVMTRGGFLPLSETEER